MSASPPTTAVSVSATLDYKGTPIPVNTGDLAQLKKGNFQFTLTEPVYVGTIQLFLVWLNTEFGLPNLDPEVRQAIKFLQDSGIDIVVALGNLLNGIYEGHIYITTLVLNTATSTYKFGVTMEIGGSPPGFPLFGGLRLDSIGVLIAHGSQEE